MRNAEVIRQWKILKTIEAGRFTSTAKLGAAYGVTERTIRRDIEALQEAGFPIYDDRVDGKKIWRLVEGYRQRVIQGFTLAELAALHFSRNLLSFLGGAPFAQDLESAFVKIRESLPAKSLPFLSRIQDLFLARPDPWKDYSKKQDVIGGLIDATLHQRQAQIAYYSFNSRRTKGYTVDPYRLVYYRGGLYLYARAHEYGEVRTFAVERIQKIEVLDQGFEMPADFSPSEYARSAFGIFGGKPQTVELLFAAEMAGYIRERNWHESQRLEDTPDGGVRLTMEVTPGFELKAWIKGFLPQVTVVRPAGLRDEIARELAQSRHAFPY
ncbi:MAG TPA: WYL domain-containing protein [Vicinamibacteria bacterium]|nr:WYL domain-containing protein [Vicinamibacteria bacterium]